MPYKKNSSEENQNFSTDPENIQPIKQINVGPDRKTILASLGYLSILYSSIFVLSFKKTSPSLNLVFVQAFFKKSVDFFTSIFSFKKPTIDLNGEEFTKMLLETKEPQIAAGMWQAYGQVQAARLSARGARHTAIATVVASATGLTIYQELRSLQNKGLMKVREEFSKDDYDEALSILAQDTVTRFSNGQTKEDVVGHLFHLLNDDMSTFVEKEDNHFVGLIRKGYDEHEPTKSFIDDLMERPIDKPAP